VTADTDTNGAHGCQPATYGSTSTLLSCGSKEGCLDGAADAPTGAPKAVPTAPEALLVFTVRPPGDARRPPPPPAPARGFCADAPSD
jgi:hypothetical protein